MRQKNFLATLLFLVAAASDAVGLAQENEAGVPRRLNLPKGFESQVVYVVPKSQGSWVSITTDPKGRLIASSQYGRMYRITPGAGETPTNVEPIDAPIGRAQGLLCAFDSLYVVAHRSHDRKTPAGLYRCKDTNGDDQYDQVKLLRKLGGASEHGPHAVILSPDKKSLYICAGNMTRIPDPESSRVPRHWEEDQFVPRLPDPNGHAAGKMAPGGWVCKTDPDGKSFELVCSGFRNEYDIAFSPQGELFTFDADMEWDVGLPWYRPTRVCHVVSGGEYGWRNGSGKWPTHYPDSLPPVAEIGPASPTGVTFGTGAKFPANYQNAMFIGDWSYGVIYAMHMKQNGASWSAEAERFCHSNALPVTDIVINPHDGAMYFLIGGRNSQSALFRIRYIGSESTDAVAAEELSGEVADRRKLEQSHQSDSGFPLDELWQNLSSEDRFIRFAARIGLEHRAAADWESKITGAVNAWATIEGAVAIGRCGSGAGKKLAAAALGKLDWQTLTRPQKFAYLRANQLLLLRAEAATRDPIRNLEKLDAVFPSGDVELDRELSKVLVVAAPDTAVAKTLQLLKKAPSQQQQVAYAWHLASAKSGWTQELHAAYFQWFLDSAGFLGGHSFGGYVKSIRDMAVENLSRDRKTELAELLAKTPQVKDPYAGLKARATVRQWKVKDLMPVTDADFANRDLENGKQMFAVGGCYKCHRLRGQGGMVGPDLTAAGNRFNTRDMLETLIEPDKTISDQYSATIFAMENGTTVNGRVVNLAGDEYWVQPDMINPDSMVKIKVAEIEQMKESKVSLMPSGLLDTMTRDDILDLIAWMRASQQR